MSERVNAALAAELLAFFNRTPGGTPAGEATRTSTQNLDRETRPVRKSAAEMVAELYEADPSTLKPPALLARATVTIKPIGAPPVEVDQEQLETALASAGVLYVAGGTSDAVMQYVAAKLKVKLPYSAIYELEQDGRPWGYQSQKG